MLIKNLVITPAKAGKYMWNCTVACDSQAQNRAMAQDGYMMGYFNAVK